MVLLIGVLVISAVQIAPARGASESAVFDRFLSSAENAPSAPQQLSLYDNEGIDQLMAQYRENSARDPLDDVLSLYPVIERASVIEFQSMDADQVSKMLSGNPDESTIIGLLLARSPRLAQAENAWRAQLKSYPQTAFLQDLLSQYQALTSNLTTGIGEDLRQNPMIQMNYPAPGMLALKGRVVEIDSEIAYREYLRQASELIADTRALLARIRNLDELISANSSGASALSTLRSVAEVQYIAGTRSFADLTRLDTESARRRDQVRQLQSMRSGLMASLATSLDLSPTVAFGELTWSDNRPSEINTDSAVNLMEQNRQELLQASLGIDKMNTMIAMARRMAAPDLTLGFSYLSTGQMTQSGGMQENTTRPSTMDTPAQSDMEGMDDSSMPPASSEMTDSNNMPNSNFQTDPMVDYRQTGFPLGLTWAAEMVDRRAEMQSMLANMTDMASGMLAMKLNDYNQSLSSERTYLGTVIPRARAAFDVTRMGYSADEYTFSDLVGAELALLTARTDLADIRLNGRLALVEIERTIGRDLETN
jgi:hypothetical protein